MKNILRVLICNSIVFCVTSCQYIRILPTENSGEERTFILNNSSGYDIRVLAFWKGKKLDEIEVKNKNQYTKIVAYPAGIGKARPNTDGKNIFNIFSDENIGSRDSILVIFDDNKAILQYCPDFYKNSLNCDKEIPKFMNFMVYKQYQVGRTKINHKENIDYRTYCYPLTPEDYARAVPLEDLKKK